MLLSSVREWNDSCDFFPVLIRRLQKLPEVLGKKNWHKNINISDQKALGEKRQRKSGKK